MKLVLLRHGESEWNKLNLFTGWTDVELSARGQREAQEAGRLLRAENFEFDICFTSRLKRAIHTLDRVLDELDQCWVPVVKRWELNERHYGALQGLNKAQTAEKYGAAQVQLWRRSYDVLPPSLEADDVRSPRAQRMVHDVDTDQLPLAESLETTAKRVIPFYLQEVEPLIHQGKQVLIAAHGNSLRALVQFLTGMSNAEVVSLNIPTGVPLVMEFDDQMKLVSRHYLGNREEIAKKAAAAQGQAVQG